MQNGMVTIEVALTLSMIRKIGDGDISIFLARGLNNLTEGRGSSSFLDAGLNNLTAGAASDASDVLHAAEVK